MTEKLRIRSVGINSVISNLDGVLVFFLSTGADLEGALENALSNRATLEGEERGHIGLRGREVERLGRREMRL